MKELDISHIALPTERRKLRKIVPEEYSKIILSRGEYYCKTDADIKRVIKKERNRVDLILINCKKASACAALIHIPDVDMFKVELSSISNLTSAISRMLGNARIPILIELRQLFTNKEILGTLKVYRKLARIVHHYEIPVILSSGAKNKFELRPYENIISLGKFIGFSEYEIKEGITEIAKELWERAMKRRKHLIIMPGVEIEGDIDDP